MSNYWTKFQKIASDQKTFTLSLSRVTDITSIQLNARAEERNETSNPLDESQHKSHHTPIKDVYQAMNRFNLYTEQAVTSAMPVIMFNNKKINNTYMER